MSESEYLLSEVVPERLQYGEHHTAVGGRVRYDNIDADKSSVVTGTDPQTFQFNLNYYNETKHNEFYVPSESYLRGKVSYNGSNLGNDHQFARVGAFSLFEEIKLTSGGGTVVDMISNLDVFLSVWYDLIYSEQTFNTALATLQGHFKYVPSVLKATTTVVTASGTPDTTTTVDEWNPPGNYTNDNMTYSTYFEPVFNSDSSGDIENAISWTFAITFPDVFVNAGKEIPISMIKNGLRYAFRTNPVRNTLIADNSNASINNVTYTLSELRYVAKIVEVPEGSQYYRDVVKQLNEEGSIPIDSHSFLVDSVPNSTGTSTSLTFHIDKKDVLGSIFAFIPALSGATTYMYGRSRDNILTAQVQLNNQHFPPAPLDVNSVDGIMQLGQIAKSMHGQYGAAVMMPYFYNAVDATNVLTPNGSLPTSILERKFCFGVSYEGFNTDDMLVGSGVNATTPCQLKLVRSESGSGTTQVYVITLITRKIRFMNNGSIVMDEHHVTI